jgi:tetratricopeptide (TPR) repeat protein
MKNLRLLVTLSFAMILGVSTIAQDLPQPSPAASFTQKVGVTDITMNYSRPSVKGREIWGGLVPYDKVWRAGANASTKIEFSTDVKINGKPVKAGKYAVYVVPSKDEWTFIISSYVDGWGVDAYTKESDVVRIAVKVMENQLTENMLFSMDQLTSNSGMLNLSWEKLKAGFSIEINTEEFAAVNLEKAVKEADNSFRTYNKAASWILENKGDVKEALVMAQKSVSQEKRFWNLTVLSEAYAANDDMKMAVKTAKEALVMSEEAKYDSYTARNKKNIEAWGK